MAKNKARILIIGGGFGGVFTALDLVGAGEVTLVTSNHGTSRLSTKNYLTTMYA